jgi:hypothetical protein
MTVHADPILRHIPAVAYRANPPVLIGWIRERLWILIITSHIYIELLIRPNNHAEKIGLRYLAFPFDLIEIHAKLIDIRASSAKQESPAYRLVLLGTK